MAPGESRELALVGTGGAGGVQGRDELGAADEHHVDAAADGAMAKRLREMTLANTDLTDDEHGRMLSEVAVGGKIVDERAVELRQSIEVELLEGLLGAEGRATQARGELLLLTTRDLILNEQGDKVSVGQLQINRKRLPITPS